jgi:ATP-binding cassette subfamily F protein 3
LRAQRDQPSGKGAKVQGNGSNQAPKRNDGKRDQARSRQGLADRTKPLRSEMQKLEQQLAGLNAEGTSLEVALASNALLPPQMAERGRRLKQVGSEIERLEQRWLELGAEIDAMTAAP